MRRFQLRQHWPWLISLALACFVVECVAIELPALRVQNAELVKGSQQIARQLTELGNDTADASNDTLPAHLATFERLSVITHDLHSLCQENGLSLSDASYQSVASADHADVKKIEITARMKGAYPALKNVLGQLLTSHEGLSLESVSIHRNHAIDATSDIEVQMTFYYRPGV